MTPAPRARPPVETQEGTMDTLASKGPTLPLCDGERDFWMQVRQGLIIQLAAIDKRLGLEPTRPRRERPERVRAWHNEDNGEYKTA